MLINMNGFISLAQSISRAKSDAATLCLDLRSNEYRKIRVRSNYQCTRAESILSDNQTYN